MATVVIMPKQGQSVESCILTEMKKKKGDVVAIGDVLFSYETDKASFEEVAQVAGTLLEVFFSEGDEIPVLTNVLVIGNPGESIEEYRPIAGNESPVDALVIAAQVRNDGKKRETQASPRARALANKQAIPVERLSGTGPHGRIIERDVQAILDVYPKSTPLAKAILKETGATLPTQGCGLGGTVKANDIDLTQPVPASYNATPSNVSPAALPTEMGWGGTSSPALFAEELLDGVTIKPLTNIRKLIAKAMFASLQNSAQLTHHLGADARRLLHWRKKVKSAMQEGRLLDMTINDFVCYAVIRALKQFPFVNAHFLGDRMKLFSKIHLGFAVDTARGLMVPTIRNADDLSIQALSNQLKEVANACKKGDISPDLLSPDAASFTVTNLGNYGVEMFTPVINLPQVAILGVNTIVLRPIDLDDGHYGVAPYLGLSLTYDHRALDGGEATRFLKQVAIEIETLDFDF